MKKSIITGLVLLSCHIHAVDSALQLRHREAGGVGYSQGYTSLDYFLTAQGDRAEILFNLRGHLFNHARSAGNVGVGVRYSLSNDRYRLGANAFYDFRDTPHLFANQVGGGVELLSQHLDLRFNGYLPVGQKRDFEEKTFQGFSGNQALIRHKLHATLPCVDGEVGVPISKHWYAAGGSYYLFRNKSHHLTTGNAWGGKARIDVAIGRYVGLGIAATYDSIFHTRIQGIFSINIPLGRKLENPQQGRDLRHIPIMRNEIIPIQDKRRSQERLADSDDPNNFIRFFFVNNTSSSGDGSFERPFASLKDAEAHSKPGDVIYVFPGDSTPRNMDEGIVLKKDQILASSGAPLQVANTEIPALTPGISPVITNVHQEQSIVVNPGRSRLDDFIFLPPVEYLFRGWNTIRKQTDPYSEAYDEGFHVVGYDDAVSGASNPPAPAPNGAGNTPSAADPFAMARNEGFHIVAPETPSLSISHPPASAPNGAGTIPGVTDPFAMARDEGFHIVVPETPPLPISHPPATTPIQANIIENYQPALIPSSAVPPPPADRGWSLPKIITDYLPGSKSQ